MARGFARMILRILGWKVVGEIPPSLHKYVVIAAPHTSWWDFPLGVVARAATGRRIYFLGKRSLFKPPFGWVMRWLGGYPVNRSKSGQIVDQVVEMFDNHRDFAIALAPEGTRQKVSAFRTGFYYIAKGAGVPVICAALDFGRRRVVFSAPFFLSPDADADLQKLWNHFAGVRGKRPGKGIQ